jgi:protein phosphatase
MPPSFFDGYCHQEPQAPARRGSRYGSRSLTPQSKIMRFPWQKKIPVRNAVQAEPAVEKITFNVFSFSETGPTRASNEDNIIYFSPDSGREIFFAMVADGMGGHNAGEIASSIACSEAEDYIQQEYQNTDIPVMLNGLIQTMHYAIIHASKNNEAYKGMGTTATALFCKDGHAWLAHVGDSRIYHYDGNILSQSTTDHTLVNHMVKEGKLSAGEAVNHDMKNILMQALGTVEKVEPEILRTDLLQKGHYYFLCSDGIYDVLSDAELHSIFNMQDAALSMECIKALCYERKAKDNVSAMLIEIAAKRTHTGNAVTREQNTML